MKRRFVVLLVILQFIGIFPVFAAERIEIPDESNGYIVKLKNVEDKSVSLFSAEGERPDHNLAFVQTLSELETLLQSGSVSYYEPNYTVKLLGTVNDEYYGKQWNLRDIHVEASWQAGLLGEGVTVAVIDSGINAKHEDFAGINILDGVNTIDGSDNTEDALGHGTFVAGIIAAARNNGVGIAGITDKINLLPVKCFDDTDEASILDICLGIYTAVDDYDCDIICLSLGTPQKSEILEQAVDYAADNDVIVVAAVGNDGSSELFYPAAYDSVIGTASYDASGLYSSFSQENGSVFVAAPGSEIFSTYIGSAHAYAAADGTSFSAPHVAALAAVARSFDPTMPADKFRELLVATSMDAGEEGYDVLYGYGKIDFQTFVDALFQPEQPAKEGFQDVPGHWAEREIGYCVRSGLFNGVSDTRFDPDGSMTRAMLVTVLYRGDNGGLPAAERGKAVFSDVSDAAWYYDAVCWAAENRIITGYGDGTFHPDEAVTREQMVAILHRYSGAPAEEDIAVLSIFSDYGAIAPYAAGAFAWGYKAGLIAGTGNSELQPSGSATRAQVAALIMRYFKRV